MDVLELSLEVMGFYRAIPLEVLGLALGIYRATPLAQGAAEIEEVDLAFELDFYGTIM